jgi:hypothetical protein
MVMYTAAIDALGVGDQLVVRDVVDLLEPVNPVTG